MPKPRRIPHFDINNYLSKDSDETPLVFGKHRGYTPLWIAENDPAYLIWAYETFTLKPCTHALYELCKLTHEGSDEEVAAYKELDGQLKFRK